MSASDWLTPAAAFVGAGLAYVGARAGVRQQDRQGRREEWGRRFSSALDKIGSGDLHVRHIGRTLLAALASSELASPEERELADRMLEQEIGYAPAGVNLRLLTPQDLADTDFIQDDDIYTDGGLE